MSSDFEYELEDPEPSKPDNPYRESIKKLASQPAPDTRPVSASPPEKQYVCGMAIVSLALGVISVVGFVIPFFGAVMGIFYMSAPFAALGAIVTGHLALKSIERSQGSERGQEMAIFGMVIGYPMFFFLLLATTAGFHFAAQRANPTSPGSQSAATNKWMTKAESSIASSAAGVCHGNNEHAVLLAKKFSERLQKRQEAAFARKKRSDFSAPKFEFVTYCQLHSNSCAFLVNIPSYRSLTHTTKRELSEQAWVAAQMVANHTLKEGDDVAVGLKGTIFYGAVMVGRTGQISSTPKQDTSKGELARFFKSDKTDRWIARRPLADNLSDQKPPPRQLVQSREILFDSPVVCDIHDFRPPVRSIAFSLRGDRVVAGMLDARLMLYDVSTGKEIGGLAQIEDCGAIESVAITPDAKKVVAADVAGRIHIFDVAENGSLSPRSVIAPHHGKIHCLCPSENGQYLVSGAADKRVAYSSLDRGNVLNYFGAEVFKQPVTAINLSTDGTRLLATDGMTLLTIDLESLAAQPRSFPDSLAKTGCLSGDGRRYAALESNQVFVWNTADGHPLRGLFPGQPTSTKCLAMSHDGTRLFIGRLGSVSVWNVDPPASLGKIVVGHQSHPVDALLVSPNGKLMATICDGETRIQVFHLRGFK